MIRPKTTKELASRIDPSYIRRPSVVRRFRAILTFLLVAGAIAIWFAVGSNARQSMVNPGHVSFAHTMWETDCAKCHDSDGHGGFRKTVSDAACMQCHTAVAHHPNQLLRTGADAHNPLALAVDDGTGQVRAANCASCHVEHKGHAALAAVADANCTQCHANIKAATVARAANAVPIMDVTTFNASGGHPYFGRLLLKPGSTLPAPTTTFDPSLLRDPTHLKFNHQTHMTGSADPGKGAASNCSICHVNRNRGAVGDDASKTAEPASLGDTRYMRPISYARDCQSCHPLTLPGGAILPHVSMDLVQGKLAHPDEFYRDWLARLPQAKRTEILAGTESEAWVADSTKTFRSSAGDWVGGLEKAKKVMEGSPQLEEAIVSQYSLDAGSSIEPLVAGSDVRVLSAYVGYAKTFAGRCTLCHEMKELSATTAQSQPASAPVAVTAPATQATDATAPATQPADAAAPATQPTGVIAAPLLATVPTGIPDAPRRWFTGSTFDHKAHQNMTCVSCHSRAKTSTDTADVLSPNLTWVEPNGATVSCADCHHHPDSRGEGAGATCVTCHTFHDHTLPTAPVERRDVMELLKGK